MTAGTVNTLLKCLAMKT